MLTGYKLDIGVRNVVSIVILPGAWTMRELAEVRKEPPHRDMYPREYRGVGKSLQYSARFIRLAEGRVDRRPAWVATSVPPMPPIGRGGLSGAMWWRDASELVVA
jgi:hypothetical protein